MTSDFSLRAMNAVHRGILKISGGRLGWHAAGMPMLDLTTTGRSSGARRSAMLSSPLQRDGSYLVVASRGGDDAHPAWYLNLVQDPRVEVVIGGAPAEQRIARVATADEHAELWPAITAVYRNYARYQEKTARQIPLVFLDPVS
jgi:deazaflavin-dependent oxidoreductase (nitroreductase family)